MPATQKHSGRACARPLRSQRCYPLLGTTIRSATWRDAGSGTTTQNRSGLGDLRIRRNERERSVIRIAQGRCDAGHDRRSQRRGGDAPAAHGGSAAGRGPRRGVRSWAPGQYVRPCTCPSGWGSHRIRLRPIETLRDASVTRRTARRPQHAVRFTSHTALTTAVTHIHVIRAPTRGGSPARHHSR